MKKNVIAILIYALLAILFLRGVLFKEGLIIGSDWSLPSSNSQMDVFARRGLYTWSDNFNLLGVKFFDSGWSFSSLVAFFSTLGVTGPVFSKILLIFLYSVVGFSAFWYAQVLGLSFKASLISGFIYLTTPLIFNYSIMGWYFLHLVMAIIPFFLWTFSLAVLKNDARYTITAGVLFSLAMLQVQSLFWFPLIMIISLPFLVSSRKSLFVYARTVLIVLAIGVLLHSGWILPIALSPEDYVRQAVSTYDVNRFEAKLSYSSILRLWGGLFNSQFETVYRKTFLPISYILPVLAISSLLVKKWRKKSFELAFLGFIPLLVFGLRSILYRIPFSTIIRDFGRMMVLSAFPYAILAAISIEELEKRKADTRFKLLFWLVLLLFFINALPFWENELSGKPRSSEDQRLRTMVFPREYQKADELLANDRADTKALYLPSGLLLSYSDNQDFFGPFREAVDIYSLLAPKPGSLAFSDKSTGPGVDYGKTIVDSLDRGEILELESLIKFTPISHVVVRKKAVGAGGYGTEIADKLSSSTNFVKTEEDENLAIYKTGGFLPHFYIPKINIYSTGNLKHFTAVTSLAEAKEPRLAVVNLPQGTKESIETGDSIVVLASKQYPTLPTSEYAADKWVAPDTAVSPNTLLYQFLLLKEAFARTRAKGDLDKADIFLWHATKRLVEAKNYNPDQRTKERLLKAYLDLATRSVEMVKKIDMTEGLIARIEKVKECLSTNEKILDDLGLISTQELGKEIKSFHKNFWDWADKLYEERISNTFIFEIPKAGKYSILIEGEELDPIEEKEKTKVGISLNNKVLSLTSNSPQDPWLLFGMEYFDEGRHQLEFIPPEIPSLVSEEGWQESISTQVPGKEGIYLKNQAPLPESALFQSINHWQSDHLYKISFDYKTERAKVSLKILEFTKSASVTERELKKETTVFELAFNKEWKNFNKIIKSRRNSQKAELVWQLTNEGGEGTFGEAQITNLKITPVIEPTIFLKMSEEILPNRKTPQSIKFARINPTKYKVCVDGAKEPYLLAFLESFDNGWRVYAKADEPCADYGKVTASYFSGEINEGTHADNFLYANIFENWGKKSIAADRHYLTNGYANSWVIEPHDVEGKENYELIIEFWPQRFLYVGLFISVLTLIVCISFLIYSKIKGKGVK